MKTLRYLLFLLMAGAAYGQPIPLVSTNGSLLYPTNFFTINSNLIVAAIGGAGGGGTGNVSTNQSQAFGSAYTQTFLGPVFFGTTNLATELSGKQPLDADLTALAAGTTIPTAITNAVSVGAPTLYAGSTNVASALAGKQSTLTFSTGTTNSGGTVTLAIAAGSNVTLATNAQTITISSSGSGGGNASTNATQTWPSGYTQTFLGTVVLGGTTTISNATFDSISAQSLTLATPGGQASGFTGGTNVATAQAALQVTPGTYTQAYSARLAEIAALSYATGDILYYSGGLTQLAIGTNGQVLTVSSGVPTWANATGGSGGGTTNLSGLTGDVSLGSLTSGQYLGYNGSKWTNATPATNPLLVNWIGSYGVGSRTNSDVSTNVLLSSFSVPPSASPILAGRYIDGAVSVIITNTNSLAAAYDFRVMAAGTEVLVASKSLSTASMEAHEMRFRLVYESATTASVFFVGNGSIPVATTGYGAFGRSTASSDTMIATNVAWTWASTNNLDIYCGLRNTGGGTASGVGVQRLGAGMYALQDQAAIISDTAFASSFNGVTNVAPSKNVFYDWAHTFDTDDDGLPDKVDLAAAGFVLTDASGVLSSSVNATTLTNLNASELRSGTVPTNRLDSSITGKQDAIGATTALTTGTLLVTSTLTRNSLPLAPSSATNIVLDFSYPVLTYTVTNNVNLVQSTNRPSATTNVLFTLIRFVGDTSDRTLSWHSSWKRLGTNITTISSNKVVVVSAMAIGSAESGVTFGIAKEE